MSSSPQTPLDAAIAYAISLAKSGSGARSLGLTQIMKLVYLGDLAFAAQNDGRTFTGVEWRFLHFGPYAAQVAHRLEPVAQIIGAGLSRWSRDDGEEDWQRYSAPDKDPGIAKGIPLVFRITMEKMLREHAGATPDLLDHVYKTEPMLHAVPGGRLDFSFAVREQPGSPQQLPVDPSARQVKSMRERIRARLAAASAGGGREVLVTVAPTYGPEFEAVTNCLEAEAGAGIPAAEGTVEFPDDLWESDWRRAHDG